MKRELVKALMQSKIIDISRVCNLICIQFLTIEEKIISLHIQSLFRVIKNARILLSSEDIYRCGKKCKPELFEWDTPGDSIFDECLIDIKEQFHQGKLVKTKFTKIGDVYLLFDTGIILQIVVDTTCFEEKYRIFDEKRLFIWETAQR